jgi:hypothetical protein
MKRAAWLAAAVVALAPAAAHGNGRFPATIDVHFRPGSADTIALQATWGLITTTDGGATWHWSCEEAVGFGGVYDPDYEFTPSGLLLATTTARGGLQLTRDMCTWSSAPPPLGPAGDDDPGIFVAQIEVGPGGVIYAMASTGSDARLYVSSDDAASFSPRSDPPPGNVDWWESFVAAPTLLQPGDRTRLYLTGYDLGQGGIKTRHLLRSDDSGATWVTLPTEAFTFGGDGADLQVVAVSPSDPDLVFARVFQASGNTIGDHVYRSTDAGASWTRVFTSGDHVSAVVVRGGGQVVLATALSGVHASSDGGATFGPAVAELPVNCLKERPADGLLFACGDALQPAYTALATASDPATWTRLMDYRDIDDAYACAAGSDQHEVCRVLRWCNVVCQFGIGDPACQPCEGQVVDAGDEPLLPPGRRCGDCSGGRPDTLALLVALAAVPRWRRRRRRIPGR